MRVIVVSTVLAMALAAAVGARAEPRLPEKVQAALECWLAERAPVEKATSIAAYRYSQTGESFGRWSTSFVGTILECVLARMALSASYLVPLVLAK